MAGSRVILITGASSGIGQAAALAFARRGERVAAAARRMDCLQALRESARTLPGAILPLAADVTRASDMEEAVRQVVAEWGRLDVLVANAGIGHRGPLVDADWIDLETVLHTNIDGVLHSVRAAIPAIRAGGRGGHILLISSISAAAPAPYAAVYGASKSFVNGLARALRGELRRDHIAVTAMLIGQTRTEFAEHRLGQTGRVAGWLPTMTAERVADRIVWASTRQRRALTLRLIDRAFLLAAALTPGWLDRLQEAVYRPRR